MSRESSKSFVAARPHGMVAIPGGSFVMGQADQDFTMTPEKTPIKRQVTVSFIFSWMKQKLLMLSIDCLSICKRLYC